MKSTALVGGMSVEKRSISVSASSTAFIPRELSTCWQNLQHSTDTQRSSKLQLPVVMAARAGAGVRLESAALPTHSDCPGLRKNQVASPEGGREESPLLISRERSKGPGHGSKGVGSAGNPPRTARPLCGLTGFSRQESPPLAL